MTSSPAPLQDDESSNTLHRAAAPPLYIPKNRAGNSRPPRAISPRGPVLAISTPGGRFVDDANNTTEEPTAYDTLSRSPILLPQPQTGLRRIRRNPPASLRTPSSPLLRPADVTSPTLSPNVSRTSSLNHHTAVTPAPASPGLHFTEDLARFPSESLHSFSFAHQGSDGIRNTQNVLKRSIDFMREKLGWACSSPRIASAQAKLAGDEELLSMMELLQKASMMSPDGLAGSAAGLGVAAGPGPLTGPAHLANENVFDRSFENPLHSPDTAETPGSAVLVEERDSVDHKDEDRGKMTSPTATEGPNLTHVDKQLEPFSPSRTTTKSAPSTAPEIPDTTPTTPPQPKRSSLKRTYTDVAGYSLRHTLTEAMAQPYHTTKSSSSAAISTTNAPTFRPPPPSSASRSGSTLNERPPHGHRNNQAQAIFTTEAQSPWTITAANDLACLVFGVSRAEVRKLGIMEVIDQSRRKWLEEKLRDPDAGATPTKQTPTPSTKSPPPTAGGSKSPTGRRSNSSSSSTIVSGALGNGITAKLLSKPPSRQTYVSRRSKTEGGAASSSPSSKTSHVTNPHHSNNKSRGVLLCGDVVPIRKMNGSTGSASLWVKEKGGGLIWVLEQIAEDIAYLTIDAIGSVVRGKGDVLPIWGLERVRKGMDVQRLVPGFPKLEGTNTGAVDYEAVERLRGFTASTSNGISIPVSVELMMDGNDNGGGGTRSENEDEQEFRISSFPHIAGIIVVNPRTMQISNSNSVFSSALFGYSRLDGLPVDELIPGFGDALRIMTEEDGVLLEDGIVIPEHSFRRARAAVAVREEKGEDGASAAAQVFLRPSGLPARHRDGAEIMVDVQMRVVVSESERGRGSEDVITEEGEDGDADTSMNDAAPATELVFALWVTYSRQLHAVNHGVGAVTPIISRPGTPPEQPPPGAKGRVRGDSEMPSPRVGVRSGEEHDDLRTMVLSQQLEQESPLQEETTTSRPSSDPTTEPYEHPSPDMIAAGARTIKKKLIEDFAILEEMGQGAYGQVKLARYKAPSAKKMVVKYVTKRRILVDTWHRDRRLGTVPLEIHVLDYLRRDGLQHPNVVEMADFFEDDTNYYIEMLPHGLPGMDLFDYIELRVTMDEAECRGIFRQVASALRHLHCVAKVVHRDIKDENVVLDGEGRVKLVDFGSAAYVKSGPFDVFVGTIDYAAPEVLRGSPYRGKEQDVWALGILLYTIVYKENPFYSIDEIMDHDLRVPYVLSEDCIDLIRRMLDRDVERRIDILGVVEHPWCVAVDDDGGEGEEEESGAGV